MLGPGTCAGAVRRGRVQGGTELLKRARHPGVLGSGIDGNGYRGVRGDVGVALCELGVGEAAAGDCPGSAPAESAPVMSARPPGQSRRATRLIVAALGARRTPRSVLQSKRLGQADGSSLTTHRSSSGTRRLGKVTPLNQSFVAFVTAQPALLGPPRPADSRDHRGSETPPPSGQPSHSAEAARRPRSRPHGAEE